MDLHFFMFSNKSCLILTTIIFFAYLTVESVSLGSSSTSCLPQNCGNGPNISFPFWVPQQQPPSCGSLGFNITCKNNYPVLIISGDDYVVRDIFYANNSVFLVSRKAFDKTNLCPTPLRNFSVDGTPFIYGSLSVDLYFFYNCTSPFSEIRYPINCATNASRLSSFAVFHTEIMEKYYIYSIDLCQSLVHVPVHIDSIKVLVNDNYTDVLRKGFLLEWQYCSNCDKQGSKIAWKLKLVIGVGSVLLSMVLIFIIHCIMKSSSSNCTATFKHKTEDDKRVEDFVKQYGSLSTKRYKYVDIKKMTNSFQVKLGGGGFGTVFKGKLSDRRLVAVKVLNSSKASGQEFINEVASIGRTCHVNIVTLLGFCFDYKKRALIYEFMPNGSLEKFIHHGHVPLKTSEHIGVDKMYEVALGIARGLDYLHRGCNTRILHLDIKPHNILLDEDFCPKIADFGLAKLYSRKESIVSILEARGTIGYIAPEVFNRNFGGVSHKSDVYSYGMLILEMVGGKKKIDAGVGSGHSSETYFPDWIYKRLKRDEILLNGATSIEENDYARKMTIVGLWCIQANPMQRPSIDEVIEMLEGSMEALEVPPKPFFSSPDPRTTITSFNTSQEVSQDHPGSTNT